MAVSLPDIIGEYVASPERYGTGGLQYAGYFEPAELAPEQVANLYLFMQNTLNVPITVALTVELPRTGGLFQSKPVLAVDKPVLEVKMSEAEAGLLTLPVTTTPDIKAGDYQVTLEPKVTAKSRGERVRPVKSESKLSRSLIDSPLGLNLVASLGATYVEKPVKKGSFSITIAGEPQPPERAPRMKANYETIWEQKDLELFNRAVHELNLRETKLQSELTLEGLYATLYAESVGRFADATMRLRIGEAIMLAKILTYTCQFFLSNANRRNGLLVPMWERAMAADVDTTHALDVVRSVGYYHLLKLAVMLSFGLIAQAVGRQYWSLEERQGVANHIADKIEAGEDLDVEFLYLPLLLAGTAINSKLRLEGEDVAASLALIEKARENRPDLFTDPEMLQAGRVFDQILKKAAE